MRGLLPLKNINMQRITLSSPWFLPLSTSPSLPQVPNPGMCHRVCSPSLCRLLSRLHSCQPQPSPCLCRSIPLHSLTTWRPTVMLWTLPWRTSLLEVMYLPLLWMQRLLRRVGNSVPLLLPPGLEQPYILEVVLQHVVSLAEQVAQLQQRLSPPDLGLSSSSHDAQ